MTTDLITALRNTHLIMHDMAEQLSDADYRTQYHQDLSPFGWHVGHCVFTESYWLRDVILNDDTISKQFDWLYVPENILKPARGPALPPIDEHLHWCEKLADENFTIFSKPPVKLMQHSLNKKNYILKFLIQHHSQHIETMAMVLAQRQLQLKPMLTVTRPIVANDNVSYNFQHYAGGNFSVGSPMEPEAFDNELPPQNITLQQFLLADSPVSNGDWLAFINDGGYQNKKYWSDAGWQWCEEAEITQPESWVRDTSGNFYEILATGAIELNSSAALSGISYFEATAFVNWLRKKIKPYSRVRLPHEYEWEVADKSNALPQSGEAWEWCENSFHPYPGFSAFPYDNYSKPWFNNNHFSLKGGSKYTQPCIRRSSFRNFYNPDKRHIFSGLRLAMDVD